MTTTTIPVPPVAEAAEVDAALKAAFPQSLAIAYASPSGFVRVKVASSLFDGMYPDEQLKRVEEILEATVSPEALAKVSTIVTFSGEEL